MFRVILLCFLTCCSSFMPLKQSESIISEDHIQVVEKKKKENYFSGQDGVNFVASDFLSYDFGRIFYDYVKDFESPRTENLSYNRSYNPINYEFISDSPIGHLHYGGFSRNLLSWSNYSINASDYTCSVSNGVLNITSNSTSAGVGWAFVYDIYLESGITYSIGLTTYSNTDLSIQAFFDVGGNRYYDSFTPSVSQNYTFYFRFSKNSTSGIASGSFACMVNKGSSLLPFEPYFTGVVQYASLPCYSFTLDKELLFNSQYNGNCYHYVLKFYSRNPNGRPLLFGVDSYVIPHLKWEDNQGNLYGDNFYVTSTMIFNNDLHYNLNNFVYSERSDDSYKPLLNCYVNNFNKEFSDDEYTLAFNTGYDDGYNNGNNYGYQRGYSQGVSDTIAGNSQAMTIFAGIMDVAFIPVNVFFLMFDYEVFGINIAGFVSGLITIAIVIILMRFIFGRKV